MKEFMDQASEQLEQPTIRMSGLRAILSEVFFPKDVSLQHAIIFSASEGYLPISVLYEPKNEAYEADVIREPDTQVEGPTNGFITLVAIYAHLLVSVCQALGWVANVVCWTFALLLSAVNWIATPKEQGRCGWADTGLGSGGRCGNRTPREAPDGQVDFLEKDGHLGGQKTLTEEQSLDSKEQPPLDERERNY
jgi:hypothetical protein